MPVCLYALCSSPLYTTFHSETHSFLSPLLSPPHPGFFFVFEQGAYYAAQTGFELTTVLALLPRAGKMHMQGTCVVSFSQYRLGQIELNPARTPTIGASGSQEMSVWIDKSGSSC